MWFYKNLLIYRYPKARTTLVEDCGNIEITLDKFPPYTRFLKIKFDLTEDHQVRTHQISAGLRCWAGNLIQNPYALNTDDD